jgi:hypothetical protein
MAHVRRPPAATDSALVINVGVKDVSRVDVVPTPSCPIEFAPAHQTAPSRTMQEWLEPSDGDESVGGVTTPGTSGVAEFATTPVVKTTVPTVRTASERRVRRKCMVNSR